MEALETELTLEERIQAQNAEYRRRNRNAARWLREATRDGDVERFQAAIHYIGEETVDGWRPAMRAIATLPSIPPEIQAAFLEVWILHKHIPLKIGHRPTAAAALRLLFPRTGETDTPLLLYRGAGANERRCRLYGFSWTTDREIARNFAQHSLAGVVMETSASKEAVLLVRSPENYYDEGEVVVDPVPTRPGEGGREVAGTSTIGMASAWPPGLRRSCCVELGNTAPCSGLTAHRATGWISR